MKLMCLVIRGQTKSKKERLRLSIGALAIVYPFKVEIASPKHRKASTPIHIRAY